MATFVIHTHGRLHEWVAEEKGYFAAEGLTDYILSAHGLLSSTKSLVQTAAISPDNRQGAYQSYEQGAMPRLAAHVIGRSTRRRRRNWAAYGASATRSRLAESSCPPIRPFARPRSLPMSPSMLATSPVVTTRRYRHWSRSCGPTRSSVGLRWVAGRSGRSDAGWQRGGGHRVRCPILPHGAAWLPQDRGRHLYDRSDGSASRDSPSKAILPRCVALRPTSM